MAIKIYTKTGDKGTTSLDRGDKSSQSHIYALKLMEQLMN